MGNSTEPLEEAQRCFQEAYQHQMRGNLDTAIALYKKSLELQPTAEAHTFLGWTYSFQGRLNDAIAECRRAIALDPEFGNPYNDIGAYYIEMQRFDEAIPWLKKAMDAGRYASHHYPHANLARVYEAKGMWREALCEFRAALAIEAGYPPATQGIARLQGLLN